jgi:hypothetical protein
MPKLAAAESRGTVTKDVSEPKASPRELISRDCAVEEAAGDRTTLPATAKPPSTAVDGAQPTAQTGGEFSEGMNKRLTFELSRLPKASRLERNAKGLPTFWQRRRCAKIGGVRSHQSQACERGSPWRRLHEVKRFE